MSLYGNPKIVFIDESDFLSKNSQAALRGIIESTSEYCRYIFAANAIHKIDPAISSRLKDICFDMTVMETLEVREPYTVRLIEKLKSLVNNIDEDRVRQIIAFGYPDYRMIANNLQFELGSSRNEKKFNIEHSEKCFS